MNAPIQSLTTPVIAGCSVGVSAHKWHHELGFVTYYTLDNAVEQIAPFGKVGPFPSPNEMQAAIDRIKAKFPGAAIVSRKCGLADDLVTDTELDTEYAKALEKLDALGA